MSRKKRSHHRKSLLIVSASLLLIIAAVAGSLYAIHAAKLASYPMKYKDQVAAMAKKYDLPVSLVMAVIRTESSFNPTAVSVDGAVGLMQILPSTGEWIASKIGMDYDDSKLTDPAVNIQMGCWYLRYLEDNFDEDMKAMLAGYNAGQNRVRGWLNNPDNVDGQGKLSVIPDTEAKNYVEKVLYAQKTYQQLYKIN